MLWFFRYGLRAVLVLWLVGALTLPRAWDPERLLQLAARLGAPTLQQARAVQDLVQRATTMDDIEKLVNINQFYNRRILFHNDIDVWGVTDYWASPLEMLHKGQGDCEDYAIAKYFTLGASGMATTKLRLVYVRAMIGGPDGVQQAHMVLAYYATPEAEPLILDNLISDVRPASRRPDLTPVFSFNAEGLWQGTQGASAGDPVVRLSRWREILAKAREQGFL